MKEWLTIRNAIGALFLVMFFRLGRSAVATTGMGFEVLLGGMLPAIGSVCMLILAGCCFSATLCEVFSTPLTRLIDRIYFGDDDRDPPPVSLRLAIAYRRESRFEEAIDECERQLEYHPSSPELWREMIRTAQESGDRDLTESLQRRAARKLKAEDRLALARECSWM